MSGVMKEKHIQVDFCVVGGGLAGLCAAVSAARRGVKVALIQDRPVLGGNASSEIRMWALGCHGENNRETGILEEILLDNMYRNPDRNFSIWDSILYEKARFEPNITLLLNCTCSDATMEGHRIIGVRAWQLTTYTWYHVQAQFFADCSGDSVLAPLTGASYRVGREAASEFGEDIAPPQADRKTMGLTCLMQARETSHPVTFIPPDWAMKFEDDSQLPHRNHHMSETKSNFWWMELGGVRDSIHDTEDIRDELLKLTFGVWDHIKNHGDHGAENWELEWVGFLPGKRESRRYVGAHTLTQGEVRAEGRFEDLVAYGGWSMDDHHPDGFFHPGHPTIFHPAPAPFGIPYGCLYSENIGNLFFAGRNISATHAALSSTRVMATCAVIGQAVGTAASLAVKHQVSPAGIAEQHIRELKQALMEDDCYLPWNRRAVPEACAKASLSATGGDAEQLRNGAERPVNGEENVWAAPLGATATYTFPEAVKISTTRLVLDSDLNRASCDGHEDLKNHPMICNRFLDMGPFGFPKTMLRAFRVEGQQRDGAWTVLAEVKNNHQRLVRLRVDAEVMALRLVPEATWGSPEVRVFAWDCE